MKVSSNNPASDWLRPAAIRDRQRTAAARPVRPDNRPAAATAWWQLLAQWPEPQPLRRWKVNNQLCLTVTDITAAAAWCYGAGLSGNSDQARLWLPGRTNMTCYLQPASGQAARPPGLGVLSYLTFRETGSTCQASRRMMPEKNTYYGRIVM